MPGVPPSEPEAFPPGVVRYVLGPLWKGPRWGEGTEPERDAVPAEHVANHRRVRSTGAVAVAGPLLDDSELRGILIFLETSEERIREFVAADPAIAGGPLHPELRPWLALDGLRTNDAA